MANHTYKNWLTLCVPRVHPLSLVAILCKQCRFITLQHISVQSISSNWYNLLLTNASLSSKLHQSSKIQLMNQLSMTNNARVHFPSSSSPPASPRFFRVPPLLQSPNSISPKSHNHSTSFYSSSRILHNVATGHWPAYSVLFFPGFQTIAKIQSNSNQSSSANYCQYFSSQLPHSALMCSALHPFTKLNSLCVL